MTGKKGTQIGAMLLALLTLAVLAVMNASASYPVATGGAGAAQSSNIDWKLDAAKAQAGIPIVRQTERFSTSRPLREIVPLVTEKPGQWKNEQNENDAVRRHLPLKPQPPGFVDAARQSALSPLVMPAPIVNFEGQYNQNGPIPPDTNGDVGRTQYVQSVNSTFQVFSKTGTSLYGPTNINTLFAGLGGLCETLNSGDPVVLYDSLADRWLVSQFTGQSNPTHECIAISVTPDATGAWYRYDFITSPITTAFEDYPHLGVWPDAYYMTTNEFGGPNFGGNYAFERDRMIRGDATARMVYFGAPDGGFLPTDLDGNPPPAGSPNYIVNFADASNLALYKFHVDWAVPANSTFTGPTTIPVTPFDFDICAATREQCIDQPGTTARLEAIADRLMFRMAYRNIGGTESLVLMHTVDGTGTGIAGERWYELRAPNGAVTVFQQGTYSPGDGVHRWMGSIAMDRLGDIAMGFSASSSSLFPSIRYAGRLVGDPLGQLSQGEATMLAGTGSEDFPAAPRWGDYSALTVDPVDECTFWYTQEYFSQTALRAWRTRIGSFKFPGCTALGTPTPVASPTANPPTSTAVAATPTPCAGGTNVTDSISTAEPTQTGRLGLSNPVSTCSLVKTAAALSDTLTRHYKSYTYTNSTGSAQCVTVSITQACGNNAVQSVTYLGSFDPANIQTNYLADGGGGGPNYSYAFTLPAGQTAVVVMIEVSPNLGCTTYNLRINPCTAGAVTPSPTPGTPSPTPVLTPSATPTTVCVGTTYQIFPNSGASMLTATNKIANECDDCVTLVSLPFPITVYGVTTNTVNVGSNGMLNFGNAQQNIYQQNCVPVLSQPPAFSRTLFAYYDDLRTDVMTPTHGIYTNVIGSPPNRQFVIRWQTTYFDTTITGDANFEAVLTEGSNAIQVIYGATDPGGAPGRGIQLNLGQYTSYACQTDPAPGDMLTYVPIGCGVTPSPTPGPPTDTPTHTPTITPTTIPTDTPTTPPGATDTATTPPGATDTPTDTPTTQALTPTATACALAFTDVPADHTFYEVIRCLACRGIINGYSSGCETGNPCFRPGNLVTRGQLSKIVSNAAGFSDTPGAQQFEDVAPGSTFYDFVWRLANRGYINGYPCGGTGEPCGTPALPYFRPNANITRGQISKIVSNAAGFTQTPGAQQYQDVAPGSTFYDYIWRLSSLGIMQGYPCGGAGEPCGTPPLPYFRPGANATRGQASKIVANTFFPGCETPSRR